MHHQGIVATDLVGATVRPRFEPAIGQGAPWLWPSDAPARAVVAGAYVSHQAHGASKLTLVLNGAQPRALFEVHAEECVLVEPAPPPPAGDLELLQQAMRSAVDEAQAAGVGVAPAVVGCWIRAVGRLRGAP